MPHVFTLQYCLRYESQYLRELGQAMDYLLQFALSMAVQETLKYTVLAGLYKNVRDITT